MTTEEFKKESREIRETILEMIYRTKSPHIGSSSSMVELMVGLYSQYLKNDPNNPTDPERDMFILSKGHGCAALFATLAHKGYFTKDFLYENFSKDGGAFEGHPKMDVARGIEFTTGSLGHGLSIAAGLAHAMKKEGKGRKAAVYLGDGELDEGTNWEAIMFAGHHKLDNLLAVVDYNKWQILGSIEEVMGLEPLADKWKAFRWGVREIDGHDPEQIMKAMSETPFEAGKPSVIIANTTKGKGVSFMENDNKWHSGCPNEEEYERAKQEIRNNA
jgi:transketolase